MAKEVPANDGGMIKVRTTTLNQHDQPVQISVGNLVVPCRLPAPWGI